MAQRLTLRAKASDEAVAELSFSASASCRAPTRFTLSGLSVQLSEPGLLHAPPTRVLAGLEGDGLPPLLPAERPLPPADETGCSSFPAPFESKPFRVALRALLSSAVCIRVATEPDGTASSKPMPLAVARLNVLERPGFKPDASFPFDAPLVEAGQGGREIGRVRGYLSWGSFPPYGAMPSGVHADGAIVGGRLLSDALPVTSRPTCPVDLSEPPLLRVGYSNTVGGTATPMPQPVPQAAPSPPPPQPAPAPQPFDSAAVFAEASLAQGLATLSVSGSSEAPQQAPYPPEPQPLPVAPVAAAPYEPQAPAPAPRPFAQAPSMKAAPEIVTFPQPQAPAAPEPAAFAQPVAPVAPVARAPSPVGGPLVLPWFWERQVDPSGRVYFLNHAAKATAWSLPTARIYELTVSSPGPLGLQLELSAASASPPSRAPHDDGSGSGAGFVDLDRGSVLVSIYVRGVNPGSLAEAAGAAAGLSGPKAGHGLVAVNGQPVWASPLDGPDGAVTAIQRAGRPVTLRFVDPLAVDPALAAAASNPGAQVSSAPRPQAPAPQPQQQQQLHMPPPQQQQQQYQQQPQAMAPRPQQPMMQPMAGYAQPQQGWAPQPGYAGAPQQQMYGAPAVGYAAPMMGHAAPMGMAVHAMPMMQQQAGLPRPYTPGVMMQPAPMMMMMAGNPAAAAQAAGWRVLVDGRGAQYFQDPMTGRASYTWPPS